MNRCEPGWCRDDNGVARTLKTKKAKMFATVLLPVLLFVPPTEKIPAYRFIESQETPELNGHYIVPLYYSSGVLTGASRGVYVPNATQLTRISEAKTVDVDKHEDVYAKAWVAAIELLETYNQISSEISWNAEITNVAKNSPLENAGLKENDILTKIEGNKTTNAALKLYNVTGPGNMTIEYLRQHQTHTTTVLWGYNEKPFSQTKIKTTPKGETVVPSIQKPLIEFGRSRELAHALYYIDYKTPQNLHNNKKIAATGTLGKGGQIGGVGGLEPKIEAAKAAGADIMFAPSANKYSAQQKGITENHGNLELVFVETLTQAVWHMCELWEKPKPAICYDVAMAQPKQATTAYNTEKWINLLLARLETKP